jgi:hypothetical protein
MQFFSKLAMRRERGVRAGAHGVSGKRLSDGMSSACRLLATQRSMKTGSSLLSFATTCGPEVFSLTGALEPVDEFDPGRALAQRTVASS